MMKVLVAGAFLIAAGCARGATIDAFIWQNGQMTDLGPATSEALAVNNVGEVVGDTPNGFGFLFQNGVLNTAVFPNQGSPLSINNSGLIAGFTFANGMPVAAIVSSGAVTTLGYLPGDNSSLASDVNDSGQVVGFSELVTAGHATNQQAFIWQSGVFTDLAFPSSYVSSTALAINAQGDVVGYLTNAQEVRSAFLYQNGQFIILNTLLPPGSDWSLVQASDLNDSDQIVGIGSINGVLHGFLYSNGTITDLGADFASSQAINNAGQVVGGDFLWTNGVITDLGGFPVPPGYQANSLQATATDINDLGQVVGAAGTPIPIFAPEPGSVFLFASGLGFLFIARRAWRA